MSSIKKISKNKLLKIFFIKAVTLYILWQVAYIVVIKPDARIDNFLTDQVVNISSFGINALGFPSYQKNNIIYISEKQIVRVENVCNGLELYMLFIGFLICFPGSLLPKIVYGIVGCTLIFVTNVLRVMLLALNYTYFKFSFEFNHKYTFTILTYIVVFFIWRDWVIKHSVIAKS